MSSSQIKKSIEHCEEMLQIMWEAIRDDALLLLTAIQPKNRDNRKDYAFKTLIATILSVRTKDETTIRVIEELWGEYSTPEQIANAPIEKLEELLFSTGFYRNKAKFVKATAVAIHEQYKDVVPDTRKELMALPGVGRKVANCVLAISFDKPAIAVDVHVHRIANRTGWIKTTKPEDTEKELEKLFPVEKWKVINGTIVSFGKKICQPIKPLCDKCPVEQYCAKIEFKNPSKKKKKASSKN